MKTPKEFLCQKCLEKFNEYEAKRKKKWRIKVLKVAETNGKIKINA